MIQSFKMAMKSIASNKMRAFLTMLGIIIGVMALVILVSLVNGATSTVTDTISSLGENMMMVTVSDDKGSPLSLDELDTWTEEDGIGAVSPCSTESVTGKYESVSDDVTVYGVAASYQDIQGLELQLGRFIKSTDLDNHTNICVASESTCEELVGYTDCIGEEISLNGARFTIVGVLEDDEDSLMSMFGASSYELYIPYTSLIRLGSSTSSNITTFYVSADADTATADVETMVTDKLLERFDNDDDAFSVTSTDSIESAMSSITSILSVLLGGIAAISLIVGGIGIMNIMLVTVTERTREIGIRKAIGATRGVILQQFLLEAVVLCMMGCLIGIGLSWVILRVVTTVVSSLDVTFKMGGGVVLISVIFCFAIGLIFGLYPANKAAKMAPIDALHYGG